MSTYVSDFMAAAADKLGKFVTFTSDNSINLDKRLGLEKTSGTVKDLAKAVFAVLASIVLLPVSGTVYIVKGGAALVKGGAAWVQSFFAPKPKEI